MLRTPSDGTALPEALHAGFKPALNEQIWSGTLLTGEAVQRPRVPDREAGRSEIAVRETCDEDALALFQLYNRALPIDGRQALTLTLEEWQDVQERRWLGRGSREYVALDGSRVCAALRLAPGGEAGQFDLLADADGLGDAATLLDLATRRIGGAGRVLGLVPRCAAPLERLLRERGLEAETDYTLLSRRTARPAAERARVTPGAAVSPGV